jgi:exodeoxyribonuclease V alpha subunit
MQNNKTDKTDKKDIKITGELSRIIFKSDSGFLIGSFHDRDNSFITATGNLINPQIGIEYSLFGDWTESPKYGRQFAFNRFETELPSDPVGIFKYLVRSCKYVGSAVGQSLVDTYGSETLKIMKSDPARIANDIQGITIERAKEIQTTLIQQEQNEKIMIELETLLDVQGMFKSLPGKLFERYRYNAAEEVKKNPYTLTQFPMVGFALADRVALHNGFSRTSVKRKAAAALHCLRENQQAGSTWISSADLIQKMRELIQIVDLEHGIQELIDTDKAILERGYVSFVGTASDEILIAKKAALMNSTIMDTEEEVAA